MTLDRLRPLAERGLDPFVGAADRIGLTPDGVSVVAIGFAALAGGAYAVAGTDVVHRYVFAADGELTLDEFMAAYADTHGWDERYYGCLSGMVSRAMDA